MFTCAIANLKPGVGKTTSSVWLSAALAERGLSTLLIDADKGRSAQRWEELADGLGYPVVSMPVTDLHRRLDAVTSGRGAVVIDVPQIEDHARIARGALRWADLWLIPVAPSGVEIDRMMADLTGQLEDVQSLRDAPAEVRVLLNRTNRASPTKSGPDAEVRAVLTAHGFHVLRTQVPHSDSLYRQTYGTPITATGTAYADLAAELLHD